MTDRELIQQALDALDVYPVTERELVEALRTRLAQPDEEPHGYLWFTQHMEQRFTHRKPREDERIGDVKPVYTAPQQREGLELIAWVYEDDEGRMMFSQTEQYPPLWDPVYRLNRKKDNQ